ncbi:tetraspanin-11 [Colletes latitarsis]|uniref:tetraspanin-11 n=1 Tax=Colletes latitarsis TaxID=2605962 RepID=UPI0040362439
MNWNKFFTGGTNHEDDRHEDETETEDEDVTDSNGTVSTDKRPRFLGIRFHNSPYDRLSQRCIKPVFLTINAATFLAGIVGVVTSIWTLTDDKIMSRLMGHRFFLITILFVGLVGSLMSLCGIIGLIRKERKFLNVYATCCLLFLCVIFVSAILSFWIFEHITINIQKDMVTSMETYNSLLSSREAWDNTHRHLKCCGIKSSSDWAKYHVSIPKSCCTNSIEECIRMTDAVAFKTGCLRNAVLLLKSHVHAISISALLIFLIVLLSFLLAICILARMKERPSSHS